MYSIVDSIIDEERKKKSIDNETVKSNQAINLELEDIVRRSHARIMIAGVGGAGNNAITRLMEYGIDDAISLAVNTDAQDLLYTTAHHKLLIGKELTQGLGAGNHPQTGEAAARESTDELTNKLRESDLLFITAGMGGGTGTGAAHVIAEIAQELGILTVSVCTLPFNVEGNKKRENAMWGLKRLADASDTIVVIPNQRLIELAPDLSLGEAFRVADEILIRGVTGVTELITKPGLVNLDFADIRTILNSGGEAIIGLGESDSSNRAEIATMNALNNPLLEVNSSKAKGALVNICGDANFTLQEAETVMRILTDELNPDVEIIWGALIDPDLSNRIKITLLLSGIESNTFNNEKEVEINSLNYNPDFE
ncbi:MAG: cell division protein FtsZ [Candidatus Lokiarchaeota archaeon]|nr:cell division protein FtsZ [Candidatus Lokiarchaeota archaeon]